MDLLFGHELGELRCFAELGEVGVLEEAVAIFEAGVEGAAQIVESEVLFAGFGKELGDAVVLMGAFAGIGGPG